MWLGEVKRETAHFWLPSTSQMRACMLKFPNVMVRCISFVGNSGGYTRKNSECSVAVIEPTTFRTQVYLFIYLFIFITSLDALSLSYRRLVGGKPLNLFHLTIIVPGTILLGLPAVVEVVHFQSLW